MDIINCDFCKLNFKTKYNLKSHIINNKACLKLRGLKLESKHICNGCQLNFTNNTNLCNHLEICTKYIIMNILEESNNKIKEVKDIHKKELIKQEEKLKNIYTKELEKKELYYKEKLLKQEEKLKEIQTKYETLQQQYNEVKEEYKVRQNKFDSVLERLAVDAVNKPSSTTTNNTVNNIRNVLSSTYTLEKLDENELIEDMRQNYTETQFKKGQKGLAEYLFKNKLKTPDDKLMICCSDKSRKKFKILDSLGNIKEDIEARFLCEKIKGPVRLVSTEIFEKIRSNLCRQQENEELSDNQQIRLINDMEKVGEDFINIYKFDENESNGEFINELSVLLHV